MERIIDNFGDDELAQIVAISTSWRDLYRRLGYKSVNKQPCVIKRIEALGLSTEHFTGCKHGCIKRNEDNIFISNSTASQTTLRRWYEKGNYTEYKCSICGLGPYWNNQPLTLTLDHINGENHDNRLENLRWVCPNCDRQLPTFCAKNQKKSNSYKDEFI